jgi:Protein of unknown function (DUF3800)
LPRQSRRTISARKVIWTAYIDEADSHGAPVMAMGGFLSLDDKWQTFNQRWNDTLYSYNLTHLHAVDLIHKKNEFRGWDNAQHNDLVLSARELMNAHLNAGFVAVLRRDDYQKHYKALPKPKKPPEDTMYGVLLRACVSISLAAVALQLNENIDGEIVNFVLEKGGTKPNYARELFQRFKTDPQADPAFRAMLGDLDFADKKASPGCQAADLMLGGAIRQERTEHGAAPSLIEQSSFADVTQPIVEEDVATFRIPVTRAVLEALRDSMFAEADIKRQLWESRKAERRANAKV